MFPHQKVDEQPNEKPKKAFFFQKRRENDDKNVVKKGTTVGLRLARLGCVGSSKRQTVPGKLDAKRLGINSKSTVHSVYADTAADNLDFPRLRSLILFLLTLEEFTEPVYNQVNQEQIVALEMTQKIIEHSTVQEQVIVPEILPIDEQIQEQIVETIDVNLQRSQFALNTSSTVSTNSGAANSLLLWRI